ncbi:MAG TPA: DUF5335 family protein [Thermoanaerobaculia bacterium]
MQRDIERGDWESFFESFTMQHDHWRVHVDGEKQTLPLEGITARESRIVITLGGDISHHRRIIIDAARVTVEQDDGVDRGVEIESSDRHVTRLTFEEPVGR